MITNLRIHVAKHLTAGILVCLLGLQVWAEDPDSATIKVDSEHRLVTGPDGKKAEHYHIHAVIELVLDVEGYTFEMAAEDLSRPIRIVLMKDKTHVFSVLFTEKQTRYRISDKNLLPNFGQSGQPWTFTGFQPGEKWAVSIGTDGSAKSSDPKSTKFVQVWTGVLDVE